MAKLWQVEETARGQSPDARVAARQATSAAVVTELRPLEEDPTADLWQVEAGRGDPLYHLACSIFERFLTDGRIELDNNIV